MGLIYSIRAESSVGFGEDIGGLGWFVGFGVGVHVMVVAD